MMQKIYALIFVSLLSFGAASQANLAINPTINSPVNGCYLTNSETITVVLVNTSAFPYSGTCQMGYSLNWGTPVLQNVTIGFMPASGTYIYSFPVDDDFSACQSHNLKVWVYDSNDPNHLNDTVTVQVISDCAPVPGWVSGPGNVCVANNNGTLILNGSYGTPGAWESSIDNGISWGSIVTTDTFLNFTNVSNQTDIRVIVDSPYGYCPSDTTPVYTLYMDAQSYAGNLPPNFNICDNGNAGIIPVTGYVGGIIDWYLSTNSGGSWIPMTNQNDTLPYSNLLNSSWFRVVVKNGSCPADTSNNIELTLIPGTQAGTVSGESLVCNFENDSFLVATPNVGGVVAWWYSIDSGATWLPTTQGTDTFSYDGLAVSTLFAAEFQEQNCPTEFSNPGHYITVLPLGIYITPPDTAINDGASVQLTAYGGSSFNWWPDIDIDDVNIQNPIVTPTTDITYFVEVTDINGCVDTTSIDIIVLPDITTLIVPNLFTPNADGFNDAWQINNLQSFTANQMTVFNIYGQVVFEAAPYNNDWEGTYKGQKLPDGTYFYLLRLNDPLYNEPIQGVVTIAGND